MENNKDFSLLPFLVIIWVVIKALSLSSSIDVLNKKVADLENTVDYQSKQLELYIAISGEKKETTKKGGE